MQTVEYHIKLPKHLSIRLEDQIIERYGYRARGGITLLILEALEEKLNPTRTKEKTQKNELVPYTSPVLVGHNHSNSNKKVQVDSDIFRIINEIFRLYPNNEEILSFKLKSLIKNLFNIKDKRAVSSHIDLLITKKIIVGIGEYPVHSYKILIKKELLALT